MASITISISDQQLRLIREGLELLAQSMGFDTKGENGREYFSGNDSDETLILLDMARDCERDLKDGKLDRAELQGWNL